MRYKAGRVSDLVHACSIAVLPACIANVYTLMSLAGRQSENKTHAAFSKTTNKTLLPQEINV